MDSGQRGMGPTENYGRPVKNEAERNPQRLQIGVAIRVQSKIKNTLWVTYCHTDSDPFALTVTLDKFKGR